MDALKNTTKTAVLLAALGGLFIGVGTLIGGPSGAMVGLLIALVFVGGSYWFSDRLALKAAGASIVTADQEPDLYRLVASLAERANLPMPTVAVSPADQPNAFATGRGPSKAVVCVTRGLLRDMPRDELEGVLAHELMHVKHRDILIGSVAAAIGTAISFVANMAMWSTLFGGRDDDDANPALALVAMIVAPMAAGLIQMAVSRSREFDADRGAAELMGTGEPLAKALTRIESIAQRTPMQIQPAQASAWIHNPLAEAPTSKRGPDMARLFSTHPSTEDRIRRLRQMTFA